MADDDFTQTITIVAEDKTGPAFASMTKNAKTAADQTASAFSKEPGKQLSEGAKKHGEQASRSFAEAGAALRAIGQGRPLEALEIGLSNAERTTKKYAKASQSSAADITSSFLGMGAKVSAALGVVGVEEFARHSLTAGAAIDRQYSLLGNRMKLTEHQTEEVRKAIEALGDTTKQPLDQLTEGFSRFQSASQLALAEALLTYPQIAVMAKGAGAPINAIAEGAGRIINNFNIAAKDVPAALEIMNQGIQDGSLQVDELALAAPRLSAAFEQAGYGGQKGLRMMMSALDQMQGQTGSVTRSSRELVAILERTPSLMVQIRGGTEDYWHEEFARMKKNGEDVLSFVIQSLKQTGKSVESFVGEGPMASAFKYLIKHYDEVRRHAQDFDETNNTIRQNFERVSKDTQGSIENLSKAWEKVEEATKKALVAIHVPAALDKLASLLSALAYLMTPTEGQPGYAPPGARQRQRGYQAPAPRTVPEMFHDYMNQPGGSTAGPRTKTAREGALDAAKKLEEERAKAGQEAVQSPRTQQQQRSIWDRFWYLFQRTGLESLETGDPARIQKAAFHPGGGGGYGGFSGGGGSGPSGGGSGGAGSGGGGGTTRQGSAPPAGMPSGEEAPIGPDANANLAADRRRFAEELKAKPWLKDKLLGIAAGENRHPQANQAVMEETMNRASVAGHTLEQEARTTREGGYYEGYNPGALRDPKFRAASEERLRQALAGSNVSNYATDNSSQGLAQREKGSGKFVLQSEFGGRGGTGSPGMESFFSPGTRGNFSRNKWMTWRNRMAAGQQAPGSGGPATAQAGPQGWKVHPTAPWPEAPAAKEGGGDAELERMEKMHRMHQDLQEPVKIRYEHTPDRAQFMRASLHRETDRNWRQARFNAYADLSI